MGRMAIEDTRAMFEPGGSSLDGDDHLTRGAADDQLWGVHRGLLAMEALTFSERLRQVRA